MVKRWRQEWISHGRDFGNCHCGAGMGTMRKHRPYESHPSSSCRLCALERSIYRRERRTDRYAARTLIRDELRAHCAVAAHIAHIDTPIG